MTKVIMEISKVILVVLAFMTCCGAEGQYDSVCRRDDAKFLDNTLKDLKQALSHRPLDLIFIMDVSGSIMDEDFEDIRRFTEEFFYYAAVECDMYIHPNYTRTEFILFDHNAQFRLANFSRKIHGCEFIHILKSLNRENRNGATHIAKAMKLALDRFRELSRERPVESQVLFILTDGEFQDEPFEIDIQKYRLFKQEVKTYTVGVGYSEYDPRIAENVQALASNDSHYACVKDWRRKLTPDKIVPVPPVWAKATPDQMKNCASDCKEHAECACDVTDVAASHGGYKCACSAGYYQEDSRCTECPTGTCKPDVGNMKSLCVPCGFNTLTGGQVAGIIVGVVLLLLLLLLILLLCWLARKGVVTLCCCLDHTYTEPEDPRPPSFPAPLPPGVAQPTGGYPNPNYVSGYDKPGQPNRTSTIYENLTQVRTHGKTDDFKGMEKYMEVACASGPFKYLALYIIKTGALACSPGLILDVGQVNDIIMLMKTGKKGAEVMLMEATYRVDKATKGEQLHAQEVSVKRSNKLDKKGPSALWAANLGDYIVLGIGPASEDGNMENEMSSLRATWTE